MCDRQNDPTVATQNTKPEMIASTMNSLMPTMRRTTRPSSRQRCELAWIPSSPNAPLPTPDAGTGKGAKPGRDRKIAWRTTWRLTCPFPSATRPLALAKRRVPALRSEIFHRTEIPPRAAWARETGWRHWRPERTPAENTNDQGGKGGRNGKGGVGRRPNGWGRGGLAARYGTQPVPEGHGAFVIGVPRLGAV